MTMMTKMTRMVLMMMMMLMMALAIMKILFMSVEPAIQYLVDCCFDEDLHVFCFSFFAERLFVCYLLETRFVCLFVAWSPGQSQVGWQAQASGKLDRSPAD